MLKYFSVTNFRNLNIKNLKFKRINLLVGPNNSGKTNLIEAISFFSNLILSDSKKSAFLEVLNQYGWDDVLNKSITKPGKIEMKWVLNTDNSYSDLSYELEYQISPSNLIPKGFYITNEKLSHAQPAQGQVEPFKFLHCHNKLLGKGQFSVREKETGKTKNIVVDIDVTDTVFRQVSNLLDSEKFRIEFYPNFKQTVQSVQDLFERFHSYSSTDFDLKLVRDPLEIELNNKFLKRDGSNFVNVLKYLDDSFDFLDQYTEILREIIPDLQKIKISDVSETKRQLKLTINNETYKLKEMSDGTVKAMLLALILWSPNKTILALDEPELNLHPAWLKVITNWVLRSNSSEQVFISSHSPDFLDGFTDMYRQGLVNLFVANLEQKDTIRPVESRILENLFEEGWDLGDLYRVGDPTLGGWPW